MDGALGDGDRDLVERLELAEGFRDPINDNVIHRPVRYAPGWSATARKPQASLPACDLEHGEVKPIHYPHPEVRAKRASKGVLQHVSLYPDGCFEASC